MTIPMPGSPECECATCEGCAEERHEGLMREGEPCPACHVHADPSYREEKRLTAEECAAHYWQAEADEMVHNYTWHDSDFRDEEADDAYAHIHATWRRFKDAPHALEES